MDLRGWHVCAGVNYEGEEERTQLCCKVREKDFDPQ